MPIPDCGWDGMGRRASIPTQLYSWGYGEVALRGNVDNQTEGLSKVAWSSLTTTHGFHTHRTHCFSKGTSCETPWLKLDPSSIFRQCANLVKWFFFVQWSVGKQEVKPHPMYIRTEKTEKFQNAKDIQWLPGLTHISLFGQKWQRLPILQWSGGLGLPQFHFLRGSPCPLILWESLFIGQHSFKCHCSLV